jgi:hypothetical protein
MEEPKWEMLNRKAPVEELKQNPTKKLTINTRELRSDTISSGSTITSTTASSPILSPLNATRNRLPSAENKSKPPNFPPPPPPTTYLTEEDPIPTVEVSIARSVSVSKGKKQVLVPVRKASHLNANERLVARQAKTVKVTGGQYTHRPGFSQDVRIEMA